MIKVLKEDGFMVFPFKLLCGVREVPLFVAGTVKAWRTGPERNLKPFACFSGMDSILRSCFRFTVGRMLRLA